MSVALLAVGCLSSTTAASASSLSSAPSGETISVGVICSCSGAAGGAFITQEDTFKAWAKNVNASGGIQGHHVNVIAEDDAGDPGTAVSEAQSLLSSNVVAIVDMSNVDQAWSSSVEAAKVPIVIGEQSPLQAPDIYSAGTTIDALVPGDVDAAKEAGAKNLGSMYCSELASCKQLITAMSSSGKKEGVPLVFSAAISLTGVNFTAQCVAAKQANVSALVVFSAPSGIEQVASDCASQGYRPIFIVGGGTYSSAMKSQPALNDNWGPYGDLPFFDSSNASIKKMNAVLNKDYPGVLSDPNTAVESLVQIWASGVLLAHAINGAAVSSGKTVTAADVQKGLTSLKGDTLGGLSPPLTFPPGKPHPLHCWFTGRFKNGVPSVLNGGKATCLTGSKS